MTTTEIPTVETVTAAQLAERICAAFEETADSKENVSYLTDKLARKMLTVMSKAPEAAAFYVEIQEILDEASCEVFAEWSPRMTQRARDVDTILACSSTLTQEVVDILFSPMTD